MLFISRGDSPTQKDEEYMKQVCTALLVLAVPSIAWAEEATPPPETTEPSPREAPRLLLDNIVGIRVNALGPQMSDAVVTGGPLTARLHDQEGYPHRSMTLRAEAEGRVWQSLTLGGAVGFATFWTRNGGPPLNEHSYNSIQFEPRIGALIPLGSKLYLWPRVGPTIALNFGEDQEHVFGVMTDVSLVVPLHRHVFLAVGPRADYQHQGPRKYSAAGADQLNVAFGSRVGISF